MHSQKSRGWLSKNFVLQGLLQYTPSMVEVAIVVGAISTCLFVYTMAEKFLPLESEH